jgi:hypothetical protein
MKYSYVLPIAVLAFAAACSDTATSPTSPGGPLFSVTPNTFVGTLNDGSNGTPDNTPSGGHLANSSGAIQCVVDVNLSVACSAYSISGVGNTNATAILNVSYSATVDCTNNGGKLVPVKSTPQTAPVNSGPIPSDRNGGLTVAPLQNTAPTAEQFTDAATCPNGNWTKTLAGGAFTLESFTYTLTFAGKTTATVSITGSSDSCAGRR